MASGLPPDSNFSAYSREDTERLCFDNVLGRTAEASFFKDLKSRFVLVSSGWLETFGHGATLEEVIGKTDADFFPESHAEALLLEEQQVIETGRPIIKQLERAFVSGGSEKWFAVIKEPLRDAEGTIIGTWGVTRDVTAQREAELALNSSELQYRSLFEHNPQPMLAYTKDGLRIVAVSNACVAAYGYSREEFLTMTLRDIVAPEQASALTGGARTGYMAPLQSRHRYKDGTIVDVEVTSDDLMLDGQDCRIALCLNVTERKRTLDQLALARDAAIEASSMKSAFLANISHEIRTPMAGVLGMADLLLDSDLNEDQTALAAELARSGELMVELINDILDISKIEAGQLTLELMDFELRETIDSVCAGSRAKLAAKGVAFELQVDDDVPRKASGDAQRVRQIVLNLLSNAVKFTNEGQITVRVSSRLGEDGKPTIRVEVADTGIGIEPVALNRMFEPFTQADPSTTRQYGGTGLGLAIARELTELMNGTIGAASKPGAGSTFWVDIPFGAPLKAESEARPLEISAVSEEPSWATPPRVLVAEDNPVNQMVAVRTLERCGCKVDVVGNGRDALAALDRQRYDAVLMDCQMPGMDGYDATTELRRRETDGRHTPVIAMTAHAMNGAAERCFAAGMDDYIAKPVRRPQLLEMLRQWIPAGDAAAASPDPLIMDNSQLAS
jgi:PAS domain S-box-containing protein